MLVDTWRQQARYPQLRDEVRLFKRKYRPSAILVEATGQGPALISDIRAEEGMEIVPITPNEDKVTRLRTHLKVIRSGIVALPDTGPWAAAFIEEIIKFPYGSFDDQVDALTQFLDWIAEHPHLAKRPPRALGAAVNSQGTGLLPPRGIAPAMQCRGAVFVRARRRW